MRDFVADMGKSDPDAIVSESARRVLSEYKEGEKIGFEKSRDTLVSAMLGKGMSYDLISENSGLTKEQIMTIGK